MFTLKKFLLITAAAAVVGIGAALVWTHYQAGNINEAAAQSVNTEAPDITVTAMDGTEVKLSSLRGKTVFVNFWATWCGPCQMVGPVVEEIADEVTDAKICKVDVDQQPELARQYQVMSIPTFLVFKNGEMVKRDMGYKPKDELLDLLK